VSGTWAKLGNIKSEIMWSQVKQSSQISVLHETFLLSHHGATKGNFNILKLNAVVVGSYAMNISQLHLSSK
jgi:hypothetical protein